MFLKSVEGEYEPSFFIIRLLTTQAIEEAVEMNSSTFVHEYIHFLQDLFLPYCIRENLVHLATFFDHMNRAQLQGEIRLPNVVPLEGAELTSLQKSMTWGGNQFVCSVGRIVDIHPTEVPVEEHGFSLYQYDFSLDDGTRYQFGARDLLEYIAGKIESKHFPNEQKLADLPYYSVDILVGYYGVSYLSDFKRIALAEYCLQNDNPAHRLMVLLKEMQAGTIDAHTRGSDEAFAQWLKNAHWKAKGVSFETISTKIERRSNALRHDLQARFPLAAFPEIYSWLDRVIDYARANLAGKSFFAELWAADTPEFFGMISQILAEIGVPLIVNASGELGTSLGGEEGKDQFIQLLLAYEFLDYLGRDDMQCPLIGVCERDRPDLIDDDCMDAPFRKTVKDNLCPFGAFAKTHSLDRVSWYVNDRLVPRVGSHWS